ncbi:hypothetical protein COLO4_10868 [Corchorus olitorius]|uniref:Uncharacterized protein n=1 Tax=Corchorus olitorius TaxID=93759 RepID=A0A1R3K6W9_9ROSI|nr:hypothetical protein COLO4_10868 [Corchorus olitorius]
MKISTTLADAVTLDSTSPAEITQTQFLACVMATISSMISLIRPNLFMSQPLFLSVEVPFAATQSLTYPSLKTENCEETVVTPVSFHEEEINRVEEMVNRGFVLNWIASNCSICEAAGGHCGFDYSTYHFKCFCSDRPHAWHCGPGKSNRFRIIIDTAETATRSTIAATTVTPTTTSATGNPTGDPIINLPHHGAMNARDLLRGRVPEIGLRRSIGAARASLPRTGHPLPTKVPSISTAENNEYSITGSHEVTGSSTDGSSAAGKSGGNLSLDALTKAKMALQKQKLLAEKLKKIPTLNKGNSSSSGVTTGTAHGPVSAVTNAIASGQPSSSALPPGSGMAAVPGLASIPNLEAVKRAQELAAKMGFRQDPQFAPLINLFPGQVQTDVPAPQKPTKAPVLRVDALGREIDEHGNIISVTKPSNLSTLKVNINKQKKDAFQILKPELEVDPEANPHFDSRMGINKNKLLRPKRMTFQFVEEGKWSKDAEIIKLKSQFGEAKAKELKAKQAQLAKVKADINPNLIEVSERIITKEKPKEPIPEIEWWDLPILVSGSYGDIADDGVVTEDNLKMEKITFYVEHPRPIEPPAEPAPPPPQPLKLTKKEQKKLRTQRRLAREKDRQEMIRQGLLEPPKSKVKLSNLMKVLGSEATQDPTKLEMEIRSAAAEREQAHVDRNIARKLTPAERREKKERKLFDDPNTVETIVSVYKINDLSHPKTRFKVDVNAQENRLTGCAVISEGMTVVVVEGGSKSIKRFRFQNPGSLSNAGLGGESWNFIYFK